MRNIIPKTSPDRTPGGWQEWGGGDVEVEVRRFFVQGGVYLIVFGDGDC